MKPFEQHTALQSQYETFIGGGNPLGLATLQLVTLTGSPPFPVTHTKIENDFDFGAGYSSKLYVERCEFRASLIANFLNGKIPIKGWKCNLIINPTLAPYEMMLWSGGLMEGGGVYRFMLVSANFKV